MEASYDEIEDYWRKKWTEYPCNDCGKRWPNKKHPDEKIGSGCDGIGCEFRPDLTNEYEPKEK
jgi:hypothetical protein